ncbi:response regulator [Parapedobacter sp. ISTM3]|uniref:Response regulator receiver domain-containing protein n=1 Tax=Parapedobacter luteus TaxID=623280 RepID=A0A1T5DNA5_9SPHI|nr:MULTISPECIES: response regulator [Parapedobacter]MBK1440917.1 response regulator [Parapedobacter sp. ISTM3]SKB73198.1 Response regulator receiver domain-containing protein [Parapedobacter luteus]
MELHVMVIDDDKMFNTMAKVLLNNTGIAREPEICTSGKEALMRLKQHISADKRFLLFLDINMPVMSGWDVLDALSLLPYRNQIRVVIVTSSIDKADKERAMTYDQLAGYLVKPIKREDLSTLKFSRHLTHFFAD